LAATLFWLGNFETARQHALRGLEIWRSGSVQSPVEEVHAPVVSCLVYRGRSEWHLGEIASCQATGNTAEGIPWIEQGIRDYRATGSVLSIPTSLAQKAEALHLADRTSEALEAIMEAEALVERFEERWWSAELHRLRGVFLAALGADESQIETSICEAIRIAKQQKSFSLEKRAEATYAEYRRQKASALGGRGFRLPLW